MDILQFIYTHSTIAKKSEEWNVTDPPAVLVVVEGCVHVSAKLLGASEVPTGCPHTLSLLVLHPGECHGLVASPVDCVLVKVLSEVDGRSELGPGRRQEQQQ